MVLQRSQVILFAGLVFAIAAGMVMGLTTGLLNGPTETRAAPVPATPTPGPGDHVFQLCKVWESNGVLSGSMTFNFDVSDISQTVQVPITNVTEGSGAVCQLLSASQGVVVITENTPPGFDEPEWMSDNTQRTADNEMAFFLSVNGCTPVIFLRLTQPLVIPVSSGLVRCTITFFNEDNDSPTATPTATATPTSSATRTPTPTIVVCVLCNRTVTPAPATSTPTTPATATVPSTQPPSTQPPSTQPPSTATAMPTSVGTQSAVLTDAQRTQTAVAAARTAAAQSTPIAPRTGGGVMGGAGGTLNIALLAAGLIVLSSGLSLVAVRGKRR